MPSNSNISVMVEKYGQSEEMEETIRRINAFKQEVKQLETSRRRLTDFQPGSQLALSARDAQVERINQRITAIGDQFEELQAEFEIQMVARLADDAAHTSGPRPVDDSDQESGATGTEG